MCDLIYQEVQGPPTRRLKSKPAAVWPPEIGQRCWGSSEQQRACLCHLPAVWSGLSIFISACLSFPVCKPGRGRSFVSQRITVKKMNRSMASAQRGACTVNVSCNTDAVFSDSCNYVWLQMLSLVPHRLRWKKGRGSGGGLHIDCDCPLSVPAAHRSGCFWHHLPVATDKIPYSLCKCPSFLRKAWQSMGRFLMPKRTGRVLLWSL